jgi:outer membrane protein TolC
MSRRFLIPLALMVSLACVASGCTPSQPFYFFNDEDLSHYKGVATQIEYPDVSQQSLDEVTKANTPLTLANIEAKEIWDLTLQDAILNALSNSKTLRSLGAQAFVPTTFAGGTRFGDPQRLLTTPTTTPTTFQPSIIESDPRFGAEAALSAFDAQISSSITYQHFDHPVNYFVPAIGQQSILLQNVGTQVFQVAKRAANGATFYARNYNNFEADNNMLANPALGTSGNRFPSNWTPSVELEFNQPLLQGAGVQFNRIAGASSVFGQGQVPGNYNGVAIARINHDIALADLEVGLRNLLNEIEASYWRLYYNYRDLDAKMVGRDSALQTWRKIHALFQESARGGEAEKEAQARQQYFQFRALVEAGLSDLLTSENQLRYMMGIAANDGRLIRPSTEPTSARVQFDWYEVQTEALARSPEIRQEKFRIKQHELQLLAAKNFLLPQLGIDGLYRFRGFGNTLLPPPNNNNVAFGNGYQTLLEGQFQEYQATMNFQMPVGFRQGMAGVRNEQLQLAREKAILQDQELELSHQLSNAIRNLDRFYALSQTNFNRRVAAQKEVDAVRAAYETETVTLDLLLQAQQRLADSESAYYDALSLYNLAISQMHLRKGSLLEYNNVYLAEGPWTGKAYFDARKRARERDAGLFINYGFQRPNVFSRGPINQKPGANNGLITSPIPPGPEAGPETNPAETVPAPAPVPALETGNVDASASLPAGDGFNFSPVPSAPVPPASEPAMSEAKESGPFVSGELRSIVDGSTPSGPSDANSPASLGTLRLNETPFDQAPLNQAGSESNEAVADNSTG